MKEKEMSQGQLKKVHGGGSGGGGGVEPPEAQRQSEVGTNSLGPSYKKQG